MSIEIIPLVVEALHSLEARKLASRECNASTTWGIISILIVLVGSNYLMRRLCFGSKYISATVDKLRISLLLFLMLLVKASFGTQKKIFGQVKLLYALLTKILRWSTTTTNIELLKQKKISIHKFTVLVYIL